VSPLRRANWSTACSIVFCFKSASQEAPETGSFFDNLSRPAGVRVRRRNPERSRRICSSESRRESVAKFLVAALHCGENGSGARFRYRADRKSLPLPIIFRIFKRMSRRADSACVFQNVSISTQIPGHVPVHVFVDSKSSARNPGIPGMFLSTNEAAVSTGTQLEVSSVSSVV